MRFDELGGPEVLKLHEVRLDPPGPNKVLVRVDAIGLNRAEALFRAGTYYYQPTLPGSRLGSNVQFGKIVVTTFPNRVHSGRT